MEAVDANLSRSRGPDAILAGVTDTQPPRARPTLAEIGREASRLARRAALLAELEAQGWNLTSTGSALGIPNVSNLIRTIREVGLEAEYEAARAAGKIPKGPRS